MISLTIPGRGKEKKGIIEEKQKQEIARRELVIKKLYNECSYNKGDTVVPALVDRQGEGEYIVDYIDSSWKDYASGRPFKSIEWPDNDNPYLVSATNKKTSKAIIATINYFVKKP